MLEVGLFGRVAELDPRLISSQAMVGLLDKRLAIAVNQVNAAATELARVNLQLARSQPGTSDQVALLDRRHRLSLDEVEPLARAGADFVLVGDFIWADPRGAAAALTALYSAGPRPGFRPGPCRRGP